MSYQEINHINSPNYTDAAHVASVFGQPRIVKSITIHWWGDPAHRPQFDGTVNWICRPNGNSSAHVVVEAGKVAWLIDGTNAAWHSGNAAGNATSIGVECNPRASDGDYQTVGELVRDIRKIYGNIPLVRHSDWTATACPGSYDLNRINAIAYGSTVKPQGNPSPAPRPTPAPAPKPVVSKRGANDPKWIIAKGDTLTKLSRYYYGDDKNAKKIADYNGINVSSPLKIGQAIYIPGPLVWIVEAPDTYSSIAAYYGYDADYLARLNGDVNRNSIIYIGNTVKVF